MLTPGSDNDRVLEGLAKDGSIDQYDITFDAVWIRLIDPIALYGQIYSNIYCRA